MRPISHRTFGLLAALIATALLTAAALLSMSMDEAAFKVAPGPDAAQSGSG